MLKHHFVRGTIIFTDNKQPSGRYPTTGGTFLDIRTGRDLIEIMNSNGDPYLRIQEDRDRTNIMVSERSVISAVVHEINRVIPLESF